jgi:hypothetical protein
MDKAEKPEKRKTPVNTGVSLVSACVGLAENRDGAGTGL